MCIAQPQLGPLLLHDISKTPHQNAMMARVPDLVRDSELEPDFLPDYSVETVHTFLKPDPLSRRRLVPRREHWKRERCIGSGGFGRDYMARKVHPWTR